MTEKVAITIRLNKPIHDALVKYKKLTGMSVSSQIYAGIASWLFTKKLLTLEEANGEKMDLEVINQELPEGVKYCDGDSCNVPM